VQVTRLDVIDVRFPTSRELDGSDAMNPDPDYSGAYVAIVTDEPGLLGTSLVFTIGRGNDVVCSALSALAPYVVGRDVGELIADLGGFSRDLVWDSQLRWLGPEKGVMHMAIGGVVNAAWDLCARVEGKPLWRVLTDRAPEEIVALIDFTYIDDMLTPADALAHLQSMAGGKPARVEALLRDGLPAYATSPGWLGYDDDKLAHEVVEVVADGFTLVKLKVGRNVDDDIRRLKVARDAGGPGVVFAVDANQRWGVTQAIEWVNRLAEFDPYWIEEPTSPDDILGHAAVRAGVAPVRVASGEHIANRIMFKQYLQAGALDVLQIDACRVGGVNENLAILLLAAHAGVPVCPHAGGVGLCEMVQHLAMFDFVAVTGTSDGRWIEYVDHLHEHFETPVVVRQGRYLAPTEPGGGARFHPETIERFTFPTGAEWR
jgi:L-fuconate dehydratase